MQSRPSVRSVKNLLSTALLVEGAILLLAALLRLWGLDIKPAHFDEGINGWFVDQMRANGFYRYDPENYHGPLYFYVLFVFLTLGGRNLWALRLPTVIASLASVWVAL
jgi:predicted membrane-bound mannosyltransferase